MKIDTRVVKDVTVFTVYGDFTFSTLGETRDSIKKEIASSSSTKFLVDLLEARMIDSTGVGTIVAIYRTVLARQGRFGVIAPSGDMNELFYMVGLNKLFPIYDNESQAVSSV